MALLKQRVLLLLLVFCAAAYFGTLLSKGRSGRSSGQEKRRAASCRLDAALCDALRSEGAADKHVKCSSYRELRQFDFLHPAFRRILCRDAPAYQIGKDGYPLCRLKSPFNIQLLDIVRKGSTVTKILDTNNWLVHMFVYPEMDTISAGIVTNHTWEPEIVHKIMQLALKVPNATFLDAGCNIGVYSLLAARLGLPVVSLDANIRNLLRLRLSLSAAALDAALVWNFIGSGDQLSYLNFPGDCNVGGATKFGRDVVDSIPVMPVRSERLCSLIGTKNVVIKLDIEGGEADFLRTSGCLFTQFKVAVVQMEFLRRHMVGNDRSTVIDFFAGRNYSAWRSGSLLRLDFASASSWADGDLFLLHEDFAHLLANASEKST